MSAPPYVPPCVPPAMRRNPADKGPTDRGPTDRGPTDRGPRKRAPCPVCGQESAPEHRPFCSARCKDVDLARWLGGRYVIAGDEAAVETDED